MFGKSISKKYFTLYVYHVARIIRFLATDKKLVLASGLGPFLDLGKCFSQWMFNMVNTVTWHVFFMLKQHPVVQTFYNK